MGKAISVNQTASFDANLAREVGLPAAILYNQLLYAMQTDTAEEYMAENDGYFFYTASRFETMTAYNARTFTNASDKLVEAGYIEKKKRFRTGTVKPYCHFRFLKFYQSGSELGAETDSEFSAETIIEDKKEDITPFSHENGTLSAQPSHFSVGSNPNSTQGGVVKNTTPFAEVTTGPVSVKPRNPNRYIAPLAVELLKLSGAKSVTPGPDLRTVIQARLKQGYTEADLRLIVLTAKNDKFYKDFPVAKLLKEDIAEELLKKAKRNGGKPKSRLAQIYGA